MERCGQVTPLYVIDGGNGKEGTLASMCLDQPLAGYGKLDEESNAHSCNPHQYCIPASVKPSPTQIKEQKDQIKITLKYIILLVYRVHVFLSNI